MISGRGSSRRAKRIRILAEDKIKLIGIEDFILRVESGNEWLDSLFDSGWVRDGDVDCCMVCVREFHPLIRWRHHCRVCGNLICSGCSTTTPLSINNRQEVEVLCCVQCSYGQIIHVSTEDSVGLEDNDGVNSLVMVHTTKNASERLLRFVLDIDRTVEVDVLLTINCCWKDITCAVINSMNLPIPDIDSFLVVDSDGDEQSPVIGSSINFWTFILKFKTFVGNKVVVFLSETNSKKLRKHLLKRNKHAAEMELPDIVSSSISLHRDKELINYSDSCRSNGKVVTFEVKQKENNTAVVG